MTIIEQLRREGKNKPRTLSEPRTKSRPTVLQRFSNPPGTIVLRVMDGKLFEDEPIAWEIRSEGQPVPVLLGHGSFYGDFAVCKRWPCAGGDRYGTVIHRGVYYDNLSQWLYARCKEADPSFSTLTSPTERGVEL